MFTLLWWQFLIKSQVKVSVSVLWVVYSVCRGHNTGRGVSGVLLFILYLLDIDHLVNLTVILLSLLFILRCRLLLKRLESRLSESWPESHDD